MASAVTIRLISHGSGRGPTSLPDGRKYTSSAGSVIDVPTNSSDIQILSANGWCKVAASGTTAQRPTNLNAGETYVDTTLGKMIVFDGVVFRDPSSGASV